MNTPWTPWKQFGPLTIPHAIGIKVREEMQRFGLIFQLKHGVPLPGELGQSGVCPLRGGGRAWYCVTAGNPVPMRLGRDVVPVGNPILLTIRNLQSGDVSREWIGMMGDSVVAGGFSHDRG